MVDNKEPRTKYAPIFFGHLKAIEELPEEMQLKLFKAICYFCFYAIEPNQEEDFIVKALFESFKTVLESSVKRYKANVENGQKGGAPKGNQNAKKKQPLVNYNENNTIQPNSTQNNHVKEKVKEKEEVNEEVKENTPKHPTPTLLSKTEYQKSFFSFYDTYPRHEYRDQTFNYWLEQEYPKGTITLIMEAVEWYKEQLKENGKEAKSPLYFLKDKIWLDYVAMLKEKQKERQKTLRESDEQMEYLKNQGIEINFDENPFFEFKHKDQIYSISNEAIRLYQDYVPNDVNVAYEIENNFYDWLIFNTDKLENEHFENIIMYWLLGKYS